MKLFLKTFMIFVFMMILYNCTTTLVKKEVALRPLPDYMSKDEVMQALQAPEKAEKMDLENDPAYLERKSNLNPISELFEDYPAREKLKKGLRREKAINLSELPEDVDLRQYAGSIKSQWNGTCSAFGLIATEEVAHCKMRGECNLDLSERHFWSYYKQYSAPQALKMSTKAVALEKVWPQTQVDRPANIATFAKYKVLEHEYLGGDSKEAKMKVLKALADGYPVYFWSQTPSCMLSCAKTCKASQNGFEDGGHAYSIVGYFNKAEPVLIVKNSWGEDCGDNGYQYISFKVWDNSSYWESASIKSVGINNDVPTPPKTVTKCEYRWAWSHFWKKVKYCWEEEIE